MSIYSKIQQKIENIRKKRKVEKVTEFAERMKKVQKETGAALRKAQKKIKQ